MCVLINVGRWEQGVKNKSSFATAPLSKYITHFNETSGFPLSGNNNHVSSPALHKSYTYPQS